MRVECSLKHSLPLLLNVIAVPTGITFIFLNFVELFEQSFSFKNIFVAMKPLLGLKIDKECIQHSISKVLSSHVSSVISLVILFKHT